MDPRVGRRGFLGIRPRRWWLRPRGGHAHGKRGARVVGDGDGNRHREDGGWCVDAVGGRAACLDCHWDVSEVELFC